MRRLLVIFVTLFCVSVCFAQVQKNSNINLSSESKKSESEITFYYLEGVKYFLSNNTKSASEIFDYVTNVTHATHAPSLYYKALINFRNRNNEDAAIAIRTALEIDSLCSTYLQLYADICVEKGDIDQALKCFDKLIEIEPNNSNYLASRIFLQTSNNTPLDSVLKLVGEYEKKYGYNEMLYSIKRESFIELEKYDELLAYTRDILEANPSAQDKLLHLAQLYAARNEGHKAIEFYNKAIDAPGEKINAYIGIAEFYKLNRDKVGFANALAYIFLNKQVKAEYKIESFVGLMGMYDREEIKKGSFDTLALTLFNSEPENSEVLSIYLEYLLYKDDSKKALRICDSLYSKNALPASSEVLFVQLAYQVGDRNKAAVVGYQIAQKQPEDVLKTALAAEVLSSVGDNKKALFLINENIKAVKSDSLKSVAYGTRGDFYYKLQKTSKYYADYAKALQYDPNNVLVINNLAYFMALDGKDLNQALLYAKKANEISPQNPTYLDTQAWVNFTMGRFDEAKRLMQLALALERNPSAELLLHYGDILYALGDDFMAREYWKRAQTAGGDTKEINERMARPKAVK